MNEYLVEINITLPRGESLDDWKHVAHLYEDVRGKYVKEDSLVLARKIEREINRFNLVIDSSAKNSVSDDGSL